MRYCGARAIAFAMKAAWAAVSSFGAGVVRVATEEPTSAKKFSWPAGEQIQSMRTGCEPELWN